MSSLALIYLIFTFYLFSSSYCKNYKYLNYDEIWSIFTNLSKECAQYIRIDTSQNRYGLPSAGKCGEKKDQPCKNLIVFMTDFHTYDPSRPQVYYSGLLHGDEVLGATVLTEFAQYICNNPSRQKTTTTWVEDLLKKTYIVLTPFTNAYGYSNNLREDYVEYMNDQVGYVDPNRDFPYFNTNNKISYECMKTIAARTVNELFREHLFINVITFHGGINAIGYPWGNYVHLISNWKSQLAPDNIAAKDIATVLRLYSSSNLENANNIPDYTIGDMIDMSYPVDGGMEDWAYAAGWENVQNGKVNPIKECHPNTFNGYNSTKTIYENKEIKAMIYLIETADMKRPYDSDLGTDENIFDEGGEFYGHVTRNIRIVASLTDLASPQIKIYNLSHINRKLYFDFVPMGCMNLNSVNLYKILVNFENFSFNDKMRLIYFIKEIKQNSLNITTLYEQITSHNTTSSFVKFEEKRQKGLENLKCYWNISNDNNKISNPQGYKLEIDIENSFKIDHWTKESLNDLKDTKTATNLLNSKFKGKFYFLKGIEPDSAFSKEIHSEPNVPPQTHLVNLRTSEDYNPTNGRYNIYSQKTFPSDSYVLLLENGLLLTVDDIDSLFLSTGDIKFQYSLDFVTNENSIESLINNVTDNEYKNITIPKIYIKSVVKVENNFDRIENNIKTSNLEFKISLHLLVFSNKTNHDDYVRENIINNIDSNFNAFTNSEQIVEKSGKQVTKSFLKMKSLIEEKYNQEFKEVNNWCTQYEINEKNFIKYSYIVCDKILGQSEDIIDIKKIRNKLLSSNSNLQLNISGMEFTLTGTYSMYNPYLSAKYINSNELVCMSNLNKKATRENLFSLTVNNSGSQNLISQEDGDYIINFRKISEFKFEVKFMIDGNGTEIEGVFIKFGSSTVLNFNNEEIKGETAKILSLLKDTQIVGYNILVYVYKTKMSFVYLKDFLLEKNFDSLLNVSNLPNDIYINQCTLFEKKTSLTQQQFEDFYNFTIFNAIHENDDISEERNKKGLILVIVFTIVLIIMVLSVVLYCHLKNKNEEFKYNQFEMENIGRDFSEHGGTQIQI